METKISFLVLEENEKFFFKSSSLALSTRVFFSSVIFKHGFVTGLWSMYI